MALAMRARSVLGQALARNRCYLHTGAASQADGAIGGFADRKAGAAAAATGAVLAAIALYSAWQNEPAHFEADYAATALDPNEWRKFKLLEAKPVSHNTKLYRFKIDDDGKLGLTVASCLLTKAPIGKKKDGSPNIIIRPYTPISDPEVQGHFDLLVKTYPQGKMSLHFASLRPGDTLEMKGPVPKLPYSPNMKERIGMIAGGTGITPMFQVINEILKNPEDKTQISLIYANVTPDDILLKEKLDELSERHPNFKVYYVVDNPTRQWQGGSGYITKDMLLKGLPAPSDNNLILVCGPPGFMNHISGDKAPDRSQGKLTGLLKTLGYTEDQVYKF